MGTKVSPLSSLFDRVGAFSVETFAFHADVAMAYDRAALIELATLSARAHGELEESGVRMPMAQTSHLYQAGRSRHTLTKLRLPFPRRLTETCLSGREEHLPTEEARGRRVRGQGQVDEDGSTRRLGMFDGCDRDGVQGVAAP